MTNQWKSCAECSGFQMRDAMCGQALCEDGALWLPTWDKREWSTLWLA